MSIIWRFHCSYTTTSHKGYVKDWVPSVSMVTSKGDNFSIKPKKKEDGCPLFKGSTVHSTTSHKGYVKDWVPSASMVTFKWL